MDQYITFIGNHLLLFAALLVIVGMLVMSFFGDSLRGFKAASPAEATHLINREDAIVVDVREDNEFRSGHIVNAMHVPLGYFRDRIQKLEKYKDKPIIVGCRSGHRSGQACAMLKKAGFEKVYNLRGGVMAWQSDNLPLSKD